MALWGQGGAEADEAVVLQDHRIRRRACIPPLVCVCGGACIVCVCVCVCVRVRWCVCVCVCNDEPIGADPAQALVEDLATLKGWPEQVKLMQQHWIGKSKGAYLEFPIKREPSASSVRAAHDRSIQASFLDWFVLLIVGCCWALLTPRARQGAKAEEPLRIFTTRLDTLLGVTYVVLAPQHPLVQEIAKVSSVFLFRKPFSR